MTLFRRQTISSRYLLAASLILVAIAGCSRSIDESPADVVPASGTLAYQGRPVAQAQLTFWSDDLSEPAFALTDEQGKFRCMTNDTGEGIPPGDYLVTVSSPWGGIPDKYADVDSSPLHLTVDREENDLRIELED